MTIFVNFDIFFRGHPVLREYLRRFEAQFRPGLRLREQVGPPMLTASYRAVCGLKEGKRLRKSEIKGDI